MARYSAKLLFVWDRHPFHGRKLKRCVCEERIVTFTSKNAEFALKKANRIGKKGEVSLVSIGIKASLKFFGILQIMELESSCKDNEVWYEYRYIMSPDKKRRELIPPRDIYYIYGG